MADSASAAAPAAAAPAAAAPAAAAPAAAATATPMTRAEKKAARITRIMQVYNRIITLVGLATAFAITPRFSPSPKQMQTNRRAAEKETTKIKTNILAFRTVFTSLFGDSDPLVPEERPAKVVKNYIRRWSTLVNWWNQWCANLRRDTANTETLCPLELFVHSNPLPAYDSCNGFQTEEEVNEHIQCLINPVVGKVQNPIEADELDPEEDGPIVGLWVSTHRTIFAATAAEFAIRLMGMLTYLIDNASIVFSHNDDNDAVNDIYRHGRSPNVGRVVYGSHGGFRSGRGSHGASTRFLSLEGGPGTFFGFSLLFGHEDLRIPSSATEIRDRIQALPNGAQCLAEYTTLCENRIRTILTSRRDRDATMVLVVCTHPDCPHGRGFLYNRRAMLNPRSHRDRVQIGTACPAGHAFCARCMQIHDGICEDLRNEELAPNVKRCPTCHAGIEKNAGCNHMTCTHCGQNFCWLCMKRFNVSEQYVGHAGPDGLICPQFDQHY